MKTLSFLLAFAISILASEPVRAAAASYTTAVAPSDSVAPVNNRRVVKKQKPEATAVLSVVASVLAIVGLMNAGILLILSPIGLVLGIVALVRIGRSKGKRKGFGLAVLGTLLSMLGMAIIIAFVLAFSKMG